MPKSKKSKLRTIATFTSVAFKTVDFEDKPRFRGTFGDDVVLWLMMEMGNDGVDIVPGINQSDDGWYFVFHIGGRRYIAQVCLADPGRGLWQVTLERDITGLGSWFGGRRRGVRLPAANALHYVLQRSDKITAVWWYTERDIRAGHEGKGASEPLPTA